MGLHFLLKIDANARLERFNRISRILGSPIHRILLNLDIERKHPPGDEEACDPRNIFTEHARARLLSTGVPRIRQQVSSWRHPFGGRRSSDRRFPGTPWLAVPVSLPSASIVLVSVTYTVVR